MNSNLVQSTHRQLIQTSESFQSAKDTFYPSSDRINLFPFFGGLRHLMPTRVPFNDWYRIVFLNNCSISLGVVPGITQNINRIASKLHGWFNLLGVRVISWSDVSSKRNLIHWVGNQVSFISVPELLESIRHFLDRCSSVRITMTVSTCPSFNVGRVQRNIFTKVRQQFFQACGNRIHNPLKKISVFELGNKTRQSIFGGRTTNGFTQIGVISIGPERSRDRGGVEDECSYIGPKERLWAVSWPTSRGFKVKHHIVRQGSEYRFQPFDCAKISLLSHLALRLGHSLLPASLRRMSL